MDQTELILGMIQGGITQEKLWLLFQLIAAGAIMAMLWRATQLVIAGYELFLNKRLQVGTWLYEGTPLGPVRHKVLKKGLFRVYFYNYDADSLVVKSTCFFVKEPKEYMDSRPKSIDDQKDKTAASFGL